jgi:hypothetical protein
LTADAGFVGDAAFEVEGGVLGNVLTALSLEGDVLPTGNTQVAISAGGFGDGLRSGFRARRVAGKLRFHMETVRGKGGKIAGSSHRSCTFPCLWGLFHDRHIRCEIRATIHMRRLLLISISSHRPRRPQKVGLASSGGIVQNEWTTSGWPTGHRVGIGSKSKSKSKGESGNIVLRIGVVSRRFRAKRQQFSFWV